ncbi:hypothetical protein DFH09DRAFT_1379758 [Mycena vulgaris]|nr:hypothetical protein DFH09DRAFT_1379758 [Mycena vulgaris]
MATSSDIPVHRKSDIIRWTPKGPYDIYIITINGINYVCKTTSSSRGGCRLDEELANYELAKNSKYILPIRGLVQDNGAIVGFLLPYLGANSILWHPKEWGSEDKEILSAALMDAVHDVVVKAGVLLTDLKNENVLLGPDGVVLIDLDSRGSSYAWGNPRGDRTVRTLGSTLSALWQEVDMPHREPFEGTPTYIVEMIIECAYQTAPTSVDDLYTRYRPRMVVNTSSVLYERRQRTHDLDWDGNPLMVTPNQ